MPTKCCLNYNKKKYPVSLDYPYNTMYSNGNKKSAMFQKQGQLMKNLNWPSTCI